MYRYNRKKTMVPRALHRSTGTGSNGYRFHKLRESASLSITPSIGGAAYFTDYPNTSTDWTNFAGLYDAYICRAIKIQWVPSANVQDLTSAIGSNPNVNIPFWVYHDKNTVVTSTPTTAAAIGYDNLKVKNLLRPWTAYYRLRRNIPVNTSLTTQFGVSTRGFQSTANGAATQTVVASVPQFGQGTSNVTAGVFICTWYCIGIEPK